MFQALSSRRLKCQQSLLEFIQEATNELMWLNTKEDVEISRDWSSQNLKIAEMERIYEVTIQRKIKVNIFSYHFSA